MKIFNGSRKLASLYSEYSEEIFSFSSLILVILMISNTANLETLSAISPFIIVPIKDGKFRWMRRIILILATIPILISLWIYNTINVDSEIASWLVIGLGALLTILLFIILLGIIRGSLHRREVSTLTEQLQILENAVPDPIVTADVKGIIVGWNKAAEELFGYTKEYALGLPLTLIIPERYRVRYQAVFDRVLSTQKPQRLTTPIGFEVVKKDGIEFPIDLYITLWKHQDDFYFTGYLRNTSHIRQLEKESKEIKAAADFAIEESARLKREFVSVMNHEIHTPMTAILGFCDLMLLPTLEESQRIRYIQIIQRNGRHLLSLFGDILDFLSIETKHITIVRTLCSPRQILNNVYSLLYPQAADKGFKLVIDYKGSIPNQITTDSNRLTQILINVIGNAIKFTNSGRVTICVSLHDSQFKPVLQFEVIDTGIGMTKEQVKNLFAPFTQADTSTTREYGGIGLGLTITKKLIELLVGKISCFSRVGVGTIIQFEVEVGPINLEEEVKSKLLLPSIISPGIQSKTRILLAEDAEDTQILIKYFLNNAGMEVDIAENGLEVWEKVQKATSENKPYNLILMDVQMPKLDGYGATKLLRKEGYVGPIIFCTASITPDEEKKCYAAGCNSLMMKPFDPERLIKTINQYLEQEVKA